MNLFSAYGRQALAVGSIFVGLFAMSTTVLAATPTSGYGHGNFQRPAVVGTVASVSGSTLTVTSKPWGRGTSASNTQTATTYTVDASNATVMKNGATSALSAIAAGDMVMVQGTVSGTSVTATSIRDGMMGMMGRGGKMFGGKPGMGMASHTPAMAGNGEPVIGGNVTAVSGDTLTVTNKSNVTYSVDVTSATISKTGVTGATVSSISVGDNVVVQGTVNGTSVTASSVLDSGAPKTASSGTASAAASGQGGGFFGAIGGFFSHLFGFF